ncbi:MAG: HYR domain-containing protein [Candidatus Limnocylindrales bacterium]
MKRSMRRAVTAAITVLILSSVAALADTVPADGDAVTSGNQTLIDLGDRSPGQVVSWPVNFRLVCSGLNHASPGVTITLDLSSATVPGDGAVDATTATIGPVPATWTAAGEGCPSPAPSIASNEPSVVTMTMPTTPGFGAFTLMWSRFGVTGLTGSSAMTFQVNVVGNTAPTLHLPSGILAEATSPAGAAVTWSATATDLEDATPPTPTCAPASGATFALGMTTVRCSVTDGGGVEATGSFLVSVQDTTVPTLAGMPADQHLTSGDPTGTTLAYASPSATDLADPTPAVVCIPANGSHIPTGATTVTCTATDATGNHASASFHVDITYVAAVAWTTVWGEPVATSGATFAVRPGRTVPVKVEMLANGVEQTRGLGTLSIASCAGAAVMSMALTWDGGRWSGHLDTGALGGPGCFVTTAALDGNVAGSFRIDVRGTTSARTPAGGRARR